MNITGFFRNNFGRSDDYTPLDNAASRHPGLAVGAGVGAAAGTVIGGLVGLHSLRTDTVSIATERTEFTHPQLVGAKYIPEDCTTHYTYDSDGNINGSYQSCDSPYWKPIISQKPTGLVEERQHFTHTNWLGPVSGAAIGLGVGVLTGALIGGLADSLRKDEESHTNEAAGNRSPLIGLAAGTALGGAAGFYVGSVAQQQARELVQTVRTPVLENQRLGWVPKASDYRDLRPSVDSHRQLFYETQPGVSEPYSGRKEVVRPVPTGQFSEKVETSRSYSLTPLKGALVGAAMGAAVGGLTGVAVGVLQKHLS